MKEGLFLCLLLASVLVVRVVGRPACTQEDRHSWYNTPPHSVTTEGYFYGGLHVDRPSCDSPSDNPRGTYSSSNGLCFFTYHRIEQDNLTESDFLLSTQCSVDNNLFPDRKVQKSISGWPDECVGDFVRCYSLERDINVYHNTFCRTRWDIPDGATHVSLDCTRDTELVMERRVDNPSEEEVNWQRQQMWFAEAFYIAVIVVGTVVCLVFFCIMYFGVVQPKTQRMREERERQARRLQDENGAEPLTAQIT